MSKSMESAIRDISEKPAFGKSLRVFQVPSPFIDNLHENGRVDLPEEMKNHPVWPNQPLVLKAGNLSSQSTLALVGRFGESIRLAHQGVAFHGITGRNKEQRLLLNLLADPDVRCVVVTGPAGTGKTTLLGAYALEQTLFARGKDQGYDKLILSKPLEIVTNSRYWGTVPGDERDKFAPFLKSFEIVFKTITGRDGHAYIDTGIQKRDIEFLPLELMRGASLQDCVCWYDEAQNLNAHEMMSLGTRIDDEGGSKVFLSGDLDQRDRRIKKRDTGLLKLVKSNEFLRSPHTAHVDLIKVERGEISKLFQDVFADDVRDD